MKGKVITLATVDADGNTDVSVPTLGYGEHPEIMLQVAITGTITIQILGSLDGTTWVEMLAANASSQLAALAAVPFLRITASSTSGGSATVKAMVPRASAG